MDYGMISKVEKARKYAEERTRIHFDAFTVRFDGDNSDHTVHFDNNHWHCDCNFFHSRGVCSHTMALERVLEGMIPTTASTESA